MRSAPSKEPPAWHRGIVEKSCPADCATARCRRACREALQGRRCAAVHQVQRLPGHQVYRMRRPGDHGAPVRALHHSVSLHSAPRIIALVLGPGIIECCGGACGPLARTGQIRCALMRRTAIISYAGRLLLTCTPCTAVASGGRASSRRRLPRPRMASRRLALLRGTGGTADMASPMPVSRRDERDTSSRLDFRDPLMHPVHRGRRRCWEGPPPSVVTYTEGFPQPTPAMGWSTQSTPGPVVRLQRVIEL